MYASNYGYSKVRLTFYSPDFGYLKVKIWISKVNMRHPLFFLFFFFTNTWISINSNFEQWLFDSMSLNFTAIQKMSIVDSINRVFNTSEK